MRPPHHTPRKECIPAHAHIERSIARLVEAMARVAVGGVDGDFVAAGLEGEGDVDDEAFCAADAEVRVDYCYVGGLAWHFVVLKGCFRRLVEWWW